ncbi:MAG TPA: hypothetical protein VKQ11_19955 [Candidatus Sulfotelmatobacter sp.]|nr:hypothetical protein [Candidatus Sulfotelmatobacter sp.]
MLRKFILQRNSVGKDVGSISAVWVRWLALGLIAAAPFCCADESSNKAPVSNVNDSGLYLKVQLGRPIKFSKLKPGEIVEGTLSRDVYSADRKLFSAGSSVRLRVDHLEKRKRAPNDHWPWVVKAFAPRHENYPVFREATVAQGITEKALNVSVISMGRMRDVYAASKKNKSSGSGHNLMESGATSARKNPAPTIVMEAFEIKAASSAPGPMDSVGSHSDRAAPPALPIGTRCKIVLLSDVSASKSKAGDIVNARLIEPLLADSKAILPAGSYLKGRILKTTPPRWLSRPGSLNLDFTDITLPDGDEFALAASVADAELDERSHTRIDSEGKLHGERPGKAWMAVNLGVTAGIAKEVDDSVQLVIEAIAATATDASTAGTSRLISSCVSAVYMATRHGRDVVLPRFTEMDISLDRPLSLNTTDVAAANGDAATK